jgi:phage terminase large subunit-like protein
VSVKKFEKIRKRCQSQRTGDLWCER